MTKTEAIRIKRMINKEYYSYYSSRKEVLRVRVYAYNPSYPDKANFREEAIKRLVKLLPQDNKWEFEEVTYKGVLKDVIMLLK